MPRAEPTTPSRRRASRTSHSARPPKLARTAASVAAAAAASSPPPTLGSASASAPPLPNTTTTTKARPMKTKTKIKTPKKSTDTPTQTWRHPAELPYIRSPSGKLGTWDDIAIVRFLVGKAGFSIPPRAASTSEEVFEVRFPGASSLDGSAPGVGVDGGDGAGEENEKETKGKSVTLPTPYRLPLLWTAKYLWTSLHLVLTADPAIREQEWRETRFEILHLARLIDALLTGADGPRSPSASQSLGKGEEAVGSKWRCPPFDRALRRFWHHWLISRDEFVRDFWREFGEEEFEDGDVLELAWPRWVLKGHKGFLLTKTEVANGIDVQGFLKGFRVWGDGDGEGEGFGYPDVAVARDGGGGGEQVQDEDKAKQPPEFSESTSKRNGKEVVDAVEGGRGGEEDTDASKTKSKKKVVKKSKPTSPTHYQDESDKARNARTRKSSPETLDVPSNEKEPLNNATVDSMLVASALPRSRSSSHEEMPVDPPLPHSTTITSTTTSRPSTSQKMYIEVPPLAPDDPRRNIGRRPIERDRATVMGSVRPGTGRVVGFVGGDDGEKSEDGDENVEEEDVNVSMEPRGDETQEGDDEGIGKGKEEENAESELDLDSDLELGYPEEDESTPPFVAPPVDAPSEHETEDLIIEDKEKSEPPLSRSVSPVLPPLSSARFPPHAAPAPASTPNTQPPLPINQTPPPLHPPASTPDPLTHFLHSFTALTTELHALRAEVADLRRSRDLTTPVVLQLEERVRRVEGTLSVGNSGASFSGNAQGGLSGDGLSGRGAERDGESASAWSHPLAHLVSFAEEDDDGDAMDVDVLPQTVVGEGKLSRKRKSAGDTSGSGSVGKKRNTTTPGDNITEVDLGSRARKKAPLAFQVANVRISRGAKHLNFGTHKTTLMPRFRSAPLEFSQFMPAPVLTIPELWDEIICFVSHRPSLESVALVCRTFVASAQQKLFDKITIRDGEITRRDEVTIDRTAITGAVVAGGLAELLTSSPHLLVYIKELDVDSRHTGCFAILSGIQWTHLRTISFRNISRIPGLAMPSMETLASIPSLRKLEIWDNG
ncbi:hypothetical protein R3P38DRAFT_3297416 [Favolaschia claudopus]|uniref:F-box domain-containing protein n=1 Tax=Favolaschia claudopus TaxID=2862362 RepID=A0AAV9Z6L3_9AGAR